MGKIICTVVLASFLGGCAGHAANPVMVDQVGDNRRSCASIEEEMAGIQIEVRRLTPETEKTGKNVGLGITGAFLIVPLFFMDFTESEKTEINAYQQRYNRLRAIATEKNCSFTQVTPDPENLSVSREKAEASR